MKRFPLLLLLAVCLTSLGVMVVPAAESKPLPSGPEGVDWVLVELSGKALAAPAGGRGPATLRLDLEKKRVSGFSGVNRYFGGYEKDGEKLKLGPLASTRMGGPPEAMAAEAAFLAALGSANRWSITDGILELRHDGDVAARFAVAPVAAK